MSVKYLCYKCGKYSKVEHGTKPKCIGCIYEEE